MAARAEIRILEASQHTKRSTPGRRGSALRDRVRQEHEMRRTRPMVTTAIGGSARRLAGIALLLTFGALWAPTPLRAQLPLPASTLFEMTGFIQEATLDDPADAFSGGTLTMNNHLIVIPKYTIFQMPATSLTWAELFKNAPAPWGPTKTGLALSDKPDYTFEVTVQGNRVIEQGDRYIAALVFISNLSVQAHQGFIKSIDYSTGEFIVGGSRARLNDPIGRFGRATTHDARFTIDEDNPTVKSETGYPMCIPRTAPAVADDPLCPQGNRIPGKSIFTMSTPLAPSLQERANPALRKVALDPWRAAPFQVGDYVTVRGPIVKDAAGQYISAYAVDANVGIFTASATQPAYVSIDVLLMGTGPVDDPTLAQEGARRVRVEGFSTDFDTPVNIWAVDVDACTGEGIDRFWAIQAIDPGAPTGAVAGRWRFQPAALGVDLKGYPYLPPTREVHVTSGWNAPVRTLNDLRAGEYTAPNFEFLTPENRGVGTPIVPGNFEIMRFLTQGSGPRDGKYTGQLSPWPGTNPPVRNACAVAGPDQSVKSASGKVTLDGTQSVAANEPVGPVSYQWLQLSGPSVSLAYAATPTATFTAPTLKLGDPNAALTFQLSATPANGAPAASSRFVTVTVTAPPDTTAPTVTAPSVTGTLKKGYTLTLATTATDNVAATSVTLYYSYISNGVKQTFALAGKAGTTGQWTASFVPTISGTYTFYSVASDAAGNVSPAPPATNVASTTKSIQ